MPQLTIEGRASNLERQGSPSLGTGSSMSGPLRLSDWRRVSRRHSIVTRANLPGPAAGLDGLEDQMKPSRHHQALGHAAPVLVAAAGIAPRGWPLPHGQHRGMTSSSGEAMAGQLAVILPLWQNQSGFGWWLSTHPYDRLPAEISTAIGLAPWPMKQCLVWVMTMWITMLLGS